MRNSFPHQIHSVPVGRCFHKGLAVAQLTVQKQNLWLHQPFVQSEKSKKITHRKLDNRCATQLFRRLACAVPGSGVS
jgi:hypothetical protein